MALPWLKSGWGGWGGAEAVVRNTKSNLHLQCSLSSIFCLLASLLSSHRVAPPQYPQTSYRCPRHRSGCRLLVCRLWSRLLALYAGAPQLLNAPPPCSPLKAKVTYRCRTNVGDRLSVTSRLLILFSN
jgi:hypothetical protein